MPKMNIARSTTIHANAATVYSKLNDFNHWPKWSPWLIMEPGVSLSIADDAKYYEWNGKRTGEGNMTVTSEKENEHITYDLNFLKPWKSSAKVEFHLEEKGDQTNVTWTMDSSLPFFMFWMKKMMEGFVGMDYERGLNLLKDYVEKGEVESKLEFKGVESFPGTKYVGIKRTCSISEIEAMAADFDTLNTQLSAASVEITGAFSIYHDWNMRKMECTYTACLGVKSAVDTLPANLFNGTIPSTNIHVVRHIGAYTHLGGAWSAQMNMQRGKEFASKKGIHPFEWYHNMPGEVPDKELITDICFAAK
ncbi:MAG: SRPBCC family protein [bacterium]|nr:SRPBCC family protein [bacterium]